MCHILLLSFWVVVVIYVREPWVKLYVSYTVTCLVVFVLFPLPALTVCGSDSLCSNSVALLVSIASVEQLWRCILKILKKCFNMEIVKISWSVFRYGGFKGGIYTTPFSTKNGKLYTFIHLFIVHLRSWKHKPLKRCLKVQVFENNTVIVCVNYKNANLWKQWCHARHLRGSMWTG